ncbi:helix-turn-helix domain-containing protein [Algoriella xinjiangensis]|uniref:helix-turn-helix domain-containing protein n=1 Tax=Algoriella xinjiangensis TaxID=684065 RepID=UPI0015A59929|nr:helix-turn-helix domain-containing protein [Algoriella xinjiangensis]
MSKDIEALELFFSMEPEILSSDNQELKDKYYIIGSDLAYYLGFKKQAQKMQKQVKSDDKAWINSIHHKFVDLRYDLAINAIITKPISTEDEATLLQDSLPKISNEVEQFILIKKLQSFFLKQNNLENYAVYNRKLNELNDRLTIEKKITRNYLANKLLEKQKAQQIVDDKNLRLLSNIFSVILLGLILVVILFKKKKVEIDSSAIKTNMISDRVESQILERLEAFEKSKGYLNPTISIAILAKELDTNVKYLSSILNNIKQKSFNNYINELRIAYIVNCLKEDKKYRLYKISHLAKLSGFVSQSSFTTFFKLITGITPSIFIKKLNDDGQ